ncbi:CotH kinase family protein [Winogradskyella sp. UBA3174]|uniref:CotH kinase family protein n=1 Tax=Winogradskyella sp. UBA3174 TaxID=1947785 RepID=UPI00260013F3|nr:CotH kinase family protein [Winogradskyella sp. UBA3174]|tara:strand:+ start:32923 stop:34959 length:2037 start_codon:yes stop_codon:yes gene_type:complete
MIKKTILSLQNLILLIFCIPSFQCLNSQVFTDSNLPIVIIDTDNGDAIPDDPRIFGLMKIIQRPDGARNFVSDANNEVFLDYSGSISIEIRGFSSQFLPKKPYGFTTLSDDRLENDNVKLLGMPSENDWILNAFAYDDSMMRDFISYTMARQMGQYAVRLHYCEVVLNGDYIGLYALSEKIKRDGDRVDISKLNDDEITLPEVTGGYIMQTDRVSGDEEFAWTSNGVGYIHEKPNEDEVTAEQSAYIESVFNDLDATAQNSDIVSGYPSVIDIPAFVDYMLMSEIASNVDAYEYSTYYHKDRSGKLRAGPVWDYNLTYGNDLVQFNFDRSLTDVWQFSNGDNEGAGFWEDLFDDTKFKCYLSRRFNELISPGEPLNYDSISDLIDSNAVLISEAVLREDERWNTIDDFTGEISNMKIWIQERITWMQNNLGEFSNCNMVEIPSLVITKINYNPEETDLFPESDDLEFIVIQNTSNEIINLTGIYFSQLGISYQFPVNAVIADSESIYLAGDAATFQAKYGFAPFDTFTRDLSNKRQNLVLSDAFGNVIDEVEYLDEAPWPEEADGDGFYLELIDVNSDNAIASNWIAVSEEALNTNDFDNSIQTITVYPNPAEAKLILSSEQTIQNITIFNLLGQQVKTFQVNFKLGEIDISELTNGAYFLNLKLINGARVTKKVFKK